MHSRLLAIPLGAALSVLSGQVASAQYIGEPQTIKAQSASLPYGIITTVAGDGLPGYFGNNVPALQSELHYPQAIAVDSAGNLYIADTDNNQVREVIASTGEIVTVAGTVEAGYSGDKGPASDALLACPSGLALDSKNNLYISDSCNNVVRKVDATTKIITTAAGHYYPFREASDCGFAGDSGPAIKAQLCYPTGLAFDATGDLYISDSNNYLIRRVAANTGVITTVAGTPYGGLPAQTSDGSPATSAQLYYPNGIVIDSIGDFYFAEQNICLVRKVIAKTGLITTVAGSVNTPLGYCYAPQLGVLATTSGLDRPAGIALDSAGNLFIAAEYGCMILRVDAKTGILSLVAGNPYSDIVTDPNRTTVYYGVYGYSGDGGAATAADLSGPSALALDKSDNLYIADSNNGVIRKVTQTTAEATPAPLITPITSAYGYGFASSVQVKITDAAAGAAIHYTTDGSTPTTASMKYTGPITLTKTAPVIAFATSSTAANSNAAQGNYFQLSAPVISPKGGTFNKSQLVLLSIPDSAAKLAYTTDGTNPCTSGSSFATTRYVTLDTSVTLKAVAYIGSGCGAMAEAKFIIPSPPVVETLPETKLTETSVTLNGSLNPGDLATKYWFQYGVNCGPLNRKTAVEAMPASITTKTVSINVTGLTKGTDYCYQLTATNTKGHTNSNESSFSTKP